MAKEVTREQLAEAVSKVINQLNDSRIRYNLVLPKGSRLKRTAIDNLIDKGLFNEQSILDELDKMVEKKSLLSASEKNCIKQIFQAACNDLSRQIKDKAKEDEQKDV